MTGHFLKQMKRLQCQQFMKKERSSTFTFTETGYLEERGHLVCL